MPPSNTGCDSRHWPSLTRRVVGIQAILFPWHEMGSLQQILRFYPLQNQHDLSHFLSSILRLCKTKLTFIWISACVSLTIFHRNGLSSQLEVFFQMFSCFPSQVLNVPSSKSHNRHHVLRVLKASSFLEDPPLKLLRYSHSPYWRGLLTSCHSLYTKCCWKWIELPVGWIFQWWVPRLKFLWTFGRSREIAAPDLWSGGFVLSIT